MKYQDKSNGALSAAIKHARSFPLGSKQRESFLRSIHILNKWKKDSKLTLWADFCPYSFGFGSFICGAVIFHNASQTWSIHT